MPLTTYADTDVVRNLFSAVAFTPPANYYIGLSTTAGNRAGGNITEPSAQSQLTTALANGTAYTALAVTALDVAVASGDSIKLTSGANTQTFVASAAAAIGAVSISVTSLAANFAYPVGTLVEDITTSPGYARVAIPNTAAGFVAAGAQPAAGYEMVNAAVIAFPQSTGAWAAGASIPYFFLSDNAGGGNIWVADSLTTAVTVSATGVTVSIAAGALTVTIN